VAGSGSTIRAAYELGRNAYGFEIKKDFYAEAKEKMLSDMEMGLSAYLAEQEAIRRRNEFINAKQETFAV